MTVAGKSASEAMLKVSAVNCAVLPYKKAHRRWTQAIGFFLSELQTVDVWDIKKPPFIFT